MSFDLTNKNIQDTFQNLLQKTGSDGKLFDLTGNEVRDLTIDGTLTVNSFITSESIVNTSSGSTAFGNSSDDTHKFIGNITSSGNISSSLTGSFGRVECQTISASSGQFDGASIFLGSESLTKANIQALKQGRTLKPLAIGRSKPDVEGDDGIFDGNLTATNITASGNISASGTITGNSLVGTLGTAAQSNVTSLGTLTTLTVDDITLNASKISDSGNLEIEAGGRLLLDTTNEIILDSAAGRIDVEGNITASGNISASRTITMLTASIGGGIFTSASLSSGGVSSYDDLTDVPTNIISSSAQIASDISGSFTAASSSFSTRVTTNETKLNTIETNADVTDTSNVTSAGALMDSEVTSLSLVKGLTAAGISGSYLGEGYISSSGEIASDISGSSTALSSSLAGRVTTNETKLSGIENNADVTDTSNVTSAGALMDSELSEIATVKALTKAGISGSFVQPSSSFSTRVTTLEGNVGQAVNTNSNVTFNSINVTHFTSSFITASTIQTSGSNIFGDEITDTHLFQGHITASGDISASGDIINTKTIQMTNSSSVIDTFNTGSNNSCKYLLQVTSGSHIQSSEMLVMQNGLNAFNTEYAQIGTDVNLGSFSTSVSGANVKLHFSGDFISCSVKFNRTLI